MSLVQHRIALNEAADGMLSADDREMLFIRFAQRLIHKLGGRTVHIPTKVRDIGFERRQGELFEKLRATGMSLRDIAEEAACSKDKVHRHLSQSVGCSATAA